MIVIGFSGEAESGKSTAADIVGNYVGECRNPLQMAFGDKQKELCASIFRVPLTKFYKSKYQYCDKWGMTYRELLQKFATDFARDMIDPDFWVKQLDEAYRVKIKKNPTEVLILTDVRFSNEVEWIKKRGGIIINITSDRCRKISCAESKHKSERGLHIDLINFVVPNNDREYDFKLKLEKVIKPYL